MLCMGLQFLSKIVSGDTLRSTGVPYFSKGRSATRAYNPHTILLCSKLVPEQLTINPPLRDPRLPLKSWDKSQILQLDPRGATRTTPYYAWLAAHLSLPISRAACCDADYNLWRVGYVLWTTRVAANVSWEKKYAELRRGEPVFLRPGKEWGKDDCLRSRKQRKDIYDAGGEGYWPQEGGDWSEIHGLTASQKEALEAKWVREGVIEFKGESSSTK
ncbi:hypothetical protein V2G26_019884 [Clonostachys chloroleuca]